MDVEALVSALRRDRDLLTTDASLIVLGGEPLLAPERLLALADGAGELFSAPILVSTNGTLLTSRLVSDLARRNLEVQVSLDSHRAERHDAGRGPGTFRKATEGIRRLVDSAVPTTLSMVYSRENFRDFEPYLALALSLGASEARFIPLRAIGGGMDHTHLRPNQLDAFEHLVDLLGRRPELRPLLRRDYFSIFMTICRYSLPRTGCGIGRKVIFVDADGTVYPCPNHVEPEFACGSLPGESLAGLVHDSPVMKAMRERYVVSNYSRCRTCPFRHWCAGDCRGEVLSLTKDPAAPSPHCAELRRLFVEMIWLLAAGDERLGVHRRLRDGRLPENSYQV